MGVVTNYFRQIKKVLAISSYSVKEKRDKKTDIEREIYLGAVHRAGGGKISPYELSLHQGGEVPLDF